MSITRVCPTCGFTSTYASQTMAEHHHNRHSCAKQKTVMTRWVETINDVYPDSWLETGGPIRTVRGGYGTRHVPDHTGFGGYDLCGEIEPEPVR